MSAEDDTHDHNYGWKKNGFGQPCPPVKGSKGQYTPEESATLKRAMEEYCQLKDIDVDRLFLGEQKYLPEMKGAWKVIAQSLPHRCVQSVYRKGIRIFHPCKRGPWSEEETLFLHELVQRHGKRWAMIQGKLHRSSEACRDKYREWGIEYVKGRWCLDDLMRLLAVIRGCLKLPPLEGVPGAKEAMDLLSPHHKELQGGMVRGDESQLPDIASSTTPGGVIGSETSFEKDIGQIPAVSKTTTNGKRLLSDEQRKHVYVYVLREVRRINDYCQTNEHANISWLVISKRMVNRSRLSCFKSWEKLTNSGNALWDDKVKEEEEEKSNNAAGGEVPVAPRGCLSTVPMKPSSSVPHRGSSSSGGGCPTGTPKPAASSNLDSSDDKGRGTDDNNDAVASSKTSKKRKQRSSPEEETSGGDDPSVGSSSAAAQSKKRDGRSKEVPSAMDTGRDAAGPSTTTTNDDSASSRQDRGGIGTTTTPSSSVSATTATTTATISSSGKTKNKSKSNRKSSIKPLPPPAQEGDDMVPSVRPPPSAAQQQQRGEDSIATTCLADIIENDAETYKLLRELQATDALRHTDIDWAGLSHPRAFARWSEVLDMVEREDVNDVVLDLDSLSAQAAVLLERIIQRNKKATGGGRKTTPV